MAIRNSLSVATFMPGTSRVLQFCYWCGMFSVATDAWYSVGGGTCPCRNPMQGADVALTAPFKNPRGRHSHCTHKTITRHI